MEQLTLEGWMIRAIVRGKEIEKLSRRLHKNRLHLKEEKLKRAEALHECMLRGKELARRLSILDQNEKLLQTITRGELLLGKKAEEW